MNTRINQVCEQIQYEKLGHQKLNGETSNKTKDSSGKIQSQMEVMTRKVEESAKAYDFEAGSDPRGHLWVTWGVYLCAGKPPLADIILPHPPDLTRCDSVIGLAIPAMSGHIQYRGAAS